MSSWRSKGIKKLVKQNVLTATTYTKPFRKPNATYLDLNECPFTPFKEIRDMVLRALQRINRYPSREDYEEAKEAIARYAGVKPENILLTMGADEGLKAIFETIANPGDTITLTRPCYSMNLILARLYNLKILRVDLLQRNNEFALDPGKLKRLVQTSKLVVLENPHNPTGSLIIDSNILKELLELIEGLIVVDETYFEFCRSTVANLISNYPNLIVIRSLSKAFCLAGLRLGYVIACKELIEEFEKVILPFNLNLLQLEVAKNINKLKPFMEYVVAYIDSEKRRLTRELVNMGCKVYKSYTNFLLVDTGLRNAYKLLERKGVFVKPVMELGDSFIRVTVSLKEDNDRFINVLGELLLGQRA